MTTHTTPLTDQQLDEYEALIARTTPLGAATASPGMAAALLAEVRRLQSALAKEERLHGDTIDDRDRAQDAADRLAYAVAPEEVIGEHTADNSPWANALELVTSEAEVDRLRAAAAGTSEGPDTLAAWLYSRFIGALDAPAWDLLTDADRAYWEHHAQAVRRAVARGGFKAAAVETDGTPA